MRIRRNYRDEYEIGNAKLKDIVNLITLNNGNFELNADVFYEIITKYKSIDNIIWNCFVDFGYTNPLLSIIDYFNEDNLQSFLKTNGKQLKSLDISREDLFIERTFNELYFKKINIALPYVNEESKLILNIIQDNFTYTTSLSLNLIHRKDIIDFIYFNKFQNFIDKYKLVEMINLNEEIKEYIGQKYLGTHSIDNKIIRLLNNSKVPAYSITSEFKSNQDMLDFEYIIDGMKYFNKKNLNAFGSYFNVNRWSRPNITPKNTKIISKLQYKFSKYLLSNINEVQFIKMYMEQVQREKKQ